MSEQVLIEGEIFQRIPVRADDLPENMPDCPECAGEVGEYHGPTCLLEPCPRHPGLPVGACGCMLQPVNELEERAVRELMEMGRRLSAKRDNRRDRHGV